MSSTDTFSLQSLCINSVVENFQRFHFAHKTSKDAKLQQNLQFLQRRFSNDLATKLLLYKNTDAYFDFLINEHLTIYDSIWFQGSHYMRSMDDIFKRVPNLKIILRINEDEDLKYAVKFCPKLTEIRALSLNVTDRGIKYLYKQKDGMLPCPELKVINLVDSSITYKGVKMLIKSLPSLEKVSHKYVPHALRSIYRENLSNHQEALSFNLTELNLTLDFEEYSPNVLKTCIAVCPKVETISCAISKEEQLHALTNSRLKELDITYSKISRKINIDNFLKSSGCNLTVLDVVNCKVSMSTLAEYCPLLNVLCASEVDFIDDNCDLHLNFPCLDNISLSIKETAVMTKVCRLLSLSSSPKLKSVKFSSCKMSKELESEILALCKNSTLKTIVFNITPIEINFLRDCLLNCHSLDRFVVWSCNHDRNKLRQFLNVSAEPLPKKPRILI